MEDTKTIEYKGNKYTVPTWVKWVATDKDGSIYGYENKPEVCVVDWWCQGSRRFHKMATPTGKGWEDSLTEV